MRYAISLILFLPLFAARLETARLAPSASVWFEPNAGQVKGRTEFVGRASGAFLYMTGAEVIFTMAPAKIESGAKMRQVRMTFVGSSATAIGQGEQPTGGYSNYFTGKTEKEWVTNVPHFERLRYREVYPGIDLLYYGNGGQIEYDFEVKPGACAADIGIRFTEPVTLDANGDLLAGGIRQRKPRVFQGRREVPSWYEIEDGVVRVRLAKIDPHAPLTIDPVLDFSTYLGGPGADSINRLALAADGNLILAGHTQSPASPTLDPFQQPSIVFLAPLILKMSPDGQRILFSTILGRNGWDACTALTLGKDGSIVIGGTTRSAVFPVKNAVQDEFKSDIQMGFVTRLTSDGRTLLYSSYLGGTHYDVVADVTLDDKGNAYFVGYTWDLDFPVLLPLQAKAANNQDAFLTKVSPEGKMLFSTYYGGRTGWDNFRTVQWRSDGMLIIGGGSTSTDYPLKDPVQAEMTPRTGFSTGILTLIRDDGSAVVYSSYIGGPSFSDVSRIVVDGGGKIVVVGFVWDRAFRLKNPLFTTEGESGGYLSIFDSSGKELLYSTFLPGMWAGDAALDSVGDIYIGGSAQSSDVPLKDSFQPYRGGGISKSDAMLMKISADGRALLFSTLLGGSDGEFLSGLAIGPNRTVYAAGQAISNNFPVKNAYQSISGGGNDGFLYRITDDSVPAASSTPFSVSPGRLTFRFIKGDPAPPPVALGITGLNGQVFATVSDGWLRVTPAGLGVSGTMSVSVDASTLMPGVYQGSIKLTPSSGEATSVGIVLTVLAAAPGLFSVEPAHVAIGTDDTEITLRGSGFTSNTSVQLATVPWLLSPVRFVDSTTLRFTLPKLYFSGEANHSITVQNPDSAASAPVSVSVGRPPLAIAPRGIVSAASFTGDVISPGEILTIFGENFEAGIRVNFDGALAAPLYVTPRQLSVVAPVELAGARETNVVVQMNLERRSVPMRMTVWPARPGLFTADSSGRGLAAALNQDGSVNSSGNPAAKGSIVVLWGTGGGVENLRQQVFIDGMECEVLYAGRTDGLWQLNVRVPEFAVKGEVVWSAGQRDSVEGVFIAIRD